MKNPTKQQKGDLSKAAPDFLLIDLFCGAGGTTTGAERSGVCKVIVAINHDPIAIESHAANHADVLHITEDILITEIGAIKKHVEYWQKKYPRAKLILWASLECTNFSDAKGGLPRDADSRALANGMFRYLDELKPDLFLIENVREFMAWGELDEMGRPISRQKGKFYVEWVKKIMSYGYLHDWRILCAADFGGITIRSRYFGAFYKPGQPFSWPRPTHSKEPVSGSLFDNDLKPWRPVAEALDFSDIGKSIFERRRPLVDKTLRRILAGMKKYCSGPQIMVCNSPGYLHPVTRPIGAITTVTSKAIITPFVIRYNGNGFGHSAKEPIGAITTRDRFAVISPWIDRNFRQGRFQSIHEPAGSVLTVPKMNICSAFIVNPQYRSSGSPIHKPAPTVIARQKAYPLSLATLTTSGADRWEVKCTDSPTMIELKQFMRDNGIADIYMRMLKVIELKRIQGFPDGYVLKGTISDKKKFIGNSVETGVVSAWLKALSECAKVAG